MNIVTACACIALVAIGVSACGSSAQDPNIDGTYSVSETTKSSICATPPSPGMDTMTITGTASGGPPTETISGLGGVCPGEQNGESATFSCQITTANGNVTLQLQLTFGGSGFTGTATLAGEGSGECTDVINLVGTKQ